jgi:hypothetical protein
MKLFSYIGLKPSPWAKLDNHFILNKMVSVALVELVNQPMVFSIFVMLERTRWMYRWVSG